METKMRWIRSEKPCRDSFVACPSQSSYKSCNKLYSPLPFLEVPLFPLGPSLAFLPRDEDRSRWKRSQNAGMELVLTRTMPATATTKDAVSESSMVSAVVGCWWSSYALFVPSFFTPSLRESSCCLPRELSDFSFPKNASTYGSWKNLEYEVRYAHHHRPIGLCRVLRRPLLSSWWSCGCSFIISFPLTQTLLFLLSRVVE